MVGAWEAGWRRGGRKEFSAPLTSFPFPFQEQRKSLGVQNAETVILLADKVLELRYKRPPTSVDDRLVRILDLPCCRCQGCAENYHWLSMCIQLHGQCDLRSLWSPVKLELRLWRRGLSNEERDASEGEGKRRKAERQRTTGVLRCILGWRAGSPLHPLDLGCSRSAHLFLGIDLVCGALQTLQTPPRRTHTTSCTITPQANKHSCCLNFKLIWRTSYPCKW